MTTITVETHIAAPLDRVFAMFTDIEHSPERVSGVRNVEFMTLGGLRLGARWRETRRVMGHDVTEEMEVTAFERKRTYTITDDSHTTRMDTTFSFEPSNGGSKVRVEFSLDPQSFSARLLSPLGWAMAGQDSGLHRS